MCPYKTSCCVGQFCSKPTCDTVCAKLELQILNVGRFLIGWFMLISSSSWHIWTFSDPLLTVLACMLRELELHAFIVLFYAKSVDVVTSGHVYKDGSHTIRSAVAGKPHAIRKLHVFVFYRTGVIEVLHCGNSEFRVFCEKIVEIILKRRSCRGNTSLRYKTRKSVKWCDLYRCARNTKVTEV